MPAPHEDDSLLDNLLHSVASAAPHFVPSFDDSPAPPSSARRKQQLHDLLGGGHSADVLLWRKKHLSIGNIAGAFVIWLVFEWIGYHLVSVVAFILLVAIVLLFVWSYVADLLNRDPPRIPKLQISDEQVLQYGRLLKTEVNRLLGILHDIALGKDVKRFLQVAGILAFVVVFGTWFHFLTLVLLAVVVAHTLPLVYEKHGDSIDGFAESTVKQVVDQYKLFDKAVLSKIPRKQSSWRKRD